MDVTGEDMKRIGHLNLPPLRITSFAHSPVSPPRDTSLLSVSSTSSSSEPSTTEFPSRVQSSPIQEEDEDQLFPLPSPRRSPVSSISPSPIPSPKASPLPSPHDSSINLSPFSYVPVSKDVPTRDFASPRDGVLKAAFSRKPLPPVNGHSHHRPQTPPFSLLLSIPSDFSPAFDWDPQTVSSITTNSSRKPRPQPRRNLPTLPSLGVSKSQTRTKPLPTPTRGRGTVVSKPLPEVPPPRVPLRQPVSSSTSPIPMSSSSTSPGSPRFSGSPIARFSGSPKPRTSISPKPRSMHFFDAIKGAGADVLKGVSTIGSGSLGSM
jgi:hypothetical protein